MLLVCNGSLDRLLEILPVVSVWESGIVPVAIVNGNVMEKATMEKLVRERKIWSRKANGKKYVIYPHDPIDEGGEAFNQLTRPLVMVEIFLHFKDHPNIRNVRRQMGYNTPVELFRFLVTQIQNASEWVDPIAAEMYGYDRRRADVHAFGWDARILRMQEDELHEAIWELQTEFKITAEERKTIIYRYRESADDLKKRFKEKSVSPEEAP